MARYRAVLRKDLDRIGGRFGWDAHRTLELKALSAVLPFRTNAYVLEDLIRWHEVPDDPIFQIAFPQAAMLPAADLDRMMRLVRSEAARGRIRAEARSIRQQLKPPAADRPASTPELQRCAGIQHTSRDTVLFVPNQARMCRAFCTYCFCRPRLAGLGKRDPERSDVGALRNYLAAHREVSRVLFTGGDPLAMSSAVLRRFLEPLLGPEHEHVLTIQITSQALAYWPRRFLQDRDGEDLLRLFEEVQRSGRQLILCAHYVHPRELETKAAQDAVRRVAATGAVILGQGPILRHVNDQTATWAELWRSQVKLGIVPSSMLVEQDTGPSDYFDVPVARALQIHRDAYAEVGALARAVRGPLLRAAPGEIRVVGETRIHGERLLVLELVQARDARWVGRPFFARWDARATGLHQLRPAFGDNAFFYEEELRRIQDPPPPSVRESASRPRDALTARRSFVAGLRARERLPGSN